MKYSRLAVLERLTAQRNRPGPDPDPSYDVFVFDGHKTPWVGKFDHDAVIASLNPSDPFGQNPDGQP
jgi:hypothetical protein